MFKEAIEKYASETAKIMNGEEGQKLMEKLIAKAKEMGLTAEQWDAVKVLILRMAMAARAEANPESTKEMARAYWLEANA